MEIKTGKTKTPLPFGSGVQEISIS